MTKTALLSMILLMFGPIQTVESKTRCPDSLAYLETQYRLDPKVRAAFDLIFAGLTDLPPGYAYRGKQDNPWKVAGSGFGLKEALRDLFAQWCAVESLPQINGTHDNALDPILYFAWVYYRNPAGIDFFQGRDPSAPGEQLATGSEFLHQWGLEYRRFMDSEASAVVIPEWVADPRIEIDHYRKTKPSQYASWNEFFARNLKSDANGDYPDRPVAMKNRAYVISSPTDCIMNPLVQIQKDRHEGYRRDFVNNPLSLDTVLEVKNIPISINDLLGSAPTGLKEKFVGGNGMACVLMPNTYHHFHSPVDGTVLHAEVVKSGTPGTPGTFGYSDFPNWVPPDHNVGRPGTDFSQFQHFQRGVIILKVEYDDLTGKRKQEGYVASIPVGLDSVGAVVLNTCDSTQTDRVNCFNVGGLAKRGKTKFGNHFYGGSLDILLFSPGLTNASINTRMGAQIGTFNMGKPPDSPWALD